MTNYLNVFDLLSIMEIVFLGTSCMQPTKDRNHPAVMLIYNGEHILMDCGEGTQRQLKIAGIKPSKITKLLITHWHGDHVFGIPGLMQTLAASDYEGKLLIFGPEGSKTYMDNMMKSFASKGNINYEVTEISQGRFYDCPDYYLESYELEHLPKSLGFRFIEKDKRKIDLGKVKKIGIPEGPILGKLQNGEDVNFKGKKIKSDDVTFTVKGKIVSYLGDTRVCNNCIKVAQDSDVFISESVYASQLEVKAEERMHMTAKDAANVANKAGVKKLVLTHFSQRYKTIEEIEEEAKDSFGNVVCAYDFMKLKV
jgi:ribonuclease Z